MNRKRMEQELHALGVVDATAVLSIAEAKGITYGATNPEEWRLDAIALVEGFAPEQFAEPPALTPHERLKVYDRLTHVNRPRAAEYRDEHARAITLASVGRERHRDAIDMLRRGHEQFAHSAERRLRELTPTLENDKARLLRLRSEPATPGIEAAREVVTARVAALQQEANALERAIKQAHEEIAALMAEDRIRYGKINGSEK